MRWNPPALVVAILLAAGPVLAASPAPQLTSAEAAAIHDVIAAQLRAFRSDDSAQAFAYASPAIQSIFKNPDTFMSMVRAGYKPIYRPQEVEFRDLVPVEGRWTQRVLLVGPDGVPIVAQYVMEKQPDGSWRIDGCLLERSVEQTT